MRFVCLLMIQTMMMPIAWAGIERVFPSHGLTEARLERGATYFMQYCAGCHSLRYMQYQSMPTSARLTESATSLLSPSPVKISLTVHDATHWFGQMPPDLSLTAIARGRDWLYAYLLSFYHDKAQPYGTNNTLILNGVMPDPWASFASEQTPLSMLDKQEIACDLVTFLTYVADPSVFTRRKMGVVVMIFLSALACVLWRLKKHIWRNI